MILQNFVGAYRQSCKIILILQGNQAFWFKWKQGELLESFVEPIDSDSVGNQSLCPWIDNDSDALGHDDGMGPGADLAIELILDTSLDELDRVKVDSHSSRFVQRIQCNTLMRKLEADFPSATVRSLPDYLEPECASILHHVIPEDWDKWLRLLQARAIAITHVATGTELLCRWSGSCGVLKLLVQELGADTRHLLLDGSTPIYMRVVQKESACPDADSPNRHAQSIVQTLTHVREHVLSADKTPLVSTLALVCKDPSKEFAATRLLSALYLGHTEDLVEESLDPATLLKNKADDPPQATVLLPVEGCEWLTNRKKASQIWCQLSSRLSDGAWRLSGRGRIVSQLFTPSLHKNRQRNRIVRLQRATMLCAAMATVTTTVASFHGFNSARERYQLDAERAQLRSKVGTLSQSVSALHLAPMFVVSSLELINNHQTAEPLNPEAMLSTIAEAITRFPTVTLDALSWAVVADEHVLDETYTSAAVVSRRNKIWAENSSRANIQLELSGTVDGAGDLREKQRTVESLVAHLESVTGIRLVTVLDSPAEAVRSSADLLGSLSSYRVTILLGSL